VADHLVQGAGGGHAAGGEHDQAVALLGLAQVVGGDQHAGALLGAGPDGLPEPGPLQRVDPGGRRVQHQQVRARWRPVPAHLAELLHRHGPHAAGTSRGRIHQWDEVHEE
jgi:hypothetical protein